jgi:hypothetical protein
MFMEMFSNSSPWLLLGAVMRQSQVPTHDTVGFTDAAVTITTTRHLHNYMLLPATLLCLQTRNYTISHPKQVAG